MALPGLLQSFESHPVDAFGDVLRLQGASRPVPLGYRVEHPEQQPRREPRINIGAQVALALRILSGMSVDELVPAIRRSDLAQLTRIPGIGRKTAERMVVELRDKLAAMEAVEAEAPAASRTGLEADVLSALLNLGYERRAAEKAVEEAQRGGKGKTFEALLRATLQQLSSPAKSARAAG